MLLCWEENGEQQGDFCNEIMQTIPDMPKGCLFAVFLRSGYKKPNLEGKQSSLSCLEVTKKKHPLVRHVTLPVLKSDLFS